MSSFHRRAARVAVCVAACVSAIAATAVPGRAAAPPQLAVWLRPVDGQVVVPFRQPTSAYGPGHRGVDFAAAPSTAVRAANDGVVTFAGSVAGTLHVTVTHAGDVRTSYSFLATVAVREGQSVARGEVVGTTGGSGTDHDGTVLHFGVRVGDQYVDPMQLFRVDDLTALVRLVPAAEPSESAWTAADESRELRLSLHLPEPSDGAGAPAADDGGCGDGIPVVGGLVSAGCDVGAWVGDRGGEALDAGLRSLDTFTAVPSAVLEGLRAPLHDLVARLRAVPAAFARALAQTPSGMLALDIVAIGRRFVDAEFADCTDDAPPADGTGGSTHRVMVVAGINSSGLAGDRGPTVALDVAALGYHTDEGEVRYFSYAADGGAYTEADTYGSIPVAAQRLAEQLRAMQREQPGREVDLIAHSQGGVVVDRFLQDDYHPQDPTFPPLGTVVTLSSPHEGAPLATAGAQIRSSSVGERALDGVARLLPSFPPPSATAVQQLSERSPTIREIQASGVPEHIDFTSIGATEDVVVPATNISLRGAHETTVAVDNASEHSAIVEDPAALRAVRAALEGRAPPCVDLGTALRGAIAPVVISRLSHLGGDLAGAALGSTAR
ncbi:MAG TPA: peptidoglycan DD-metalloendopeptidase family protein [Acidimicrobiia bacterium]|nr:peptidoglycan DD-metalloendopeptidase family protein [Acidimicrobiia bacterium]